MANIIGDIAGQYKALMALIEQMPDEEVISIGDMVDRGPQSKEVIEWFMANGRAILGNHEHMMLDQYNKMGGYYQDGIWIWNGGGFTLESFNGFIPDNIIYWVKNLPKYLEIDNMLISHAFIHPSLNLDEACDIGNSARELKSDRSIIWNRSEPIRRKYELQLAGHNSQFGLRRFDDDQGTFAICLDDSRHKVLTGFNTNNMQVYQQPYIY